MTNTYSDAYPKPPNFLHTSPKSPERPKHFASRSITELSPATIPRLHRHPHLHHRPKESQLAQVASNQEYYAGGSWSEGATPHESRDASRRGSLLGLEDGPGSGREKKVVREGEVKEERERGILRATELRNALSGLNSLSNTTTRRLDNTYYSVLEKLSVLQGTIAAMKELAGLTREIHKDFRSEAAEIVNDLSAQLEGFEGFEDQEKTIQLLQERVDRGREKVKFLAKRVDLVRGRVEGWEKAEGEWQEKTRKRLRIFWVLISIIGGIFLLLAVFQYTPANTPTTAEVTAEPLGITPGLEILHNKSSAKDSAKDNKEVLEILQQDGTGPPNDPRLRVFDEL